MAILVSNTCIFYSKRQNNIVEIAQWHSERHFLNVEKVHKDLVIFGKATYEGKPPCPMVESIEASMGGSDKNSLRHCSIMVSKICTYLDLSILFLDRDNV